MRDGGGIDPGNREDTDVDMRNYVRNDVRINVRSCVRVRTTCETARNRRWILLASAARTPFRTSL